MRIQEIILREYNYLVESPDNVLLPTGERISCEQNDAIPFVVNAEDSGNVFIGGRGDYHSDFVYGVERMGVVLGYKGRVWLNSKVITFWDYPRDKAELFEILDALEFELEAEYGLKVNIVNDPEYTIEVYEGVRDDYGLMIKKGKLIPLNHFAGEMYQAPQIDHLLKQDEKQRLKLSGERLPHNTLYHAKRMAAGTKSGSPAEYKFAKERGIAENK